MEISRYIVGVDGSVPARAAIRWAVAGARERGAGVTLVHVADDEWGAVGSRLIEEVDQDAGKRLDEEPAYARALAADGPDHVAQELAGVLEPAVGISEHPQVAHAHEVGRRPPPLGPAVGPPGRGRVRGRGSRGQARGSLYKRSASPYRDASSAMAPSIHVAAAAPSRSSMLRYNDLAASSSDSARGSSTRAPAMGGSRRCRRWPFGCSRCPRGARWRSASCTAASSAARR